VIVAGFKLSIDWNMRLPLPIVVLVKLDLAVPKRYLGFFLGVCDAAAQQVNASLTRRLGRADDAI
jgi:hypothetical protein